MGGPCYVVLSDATPTTALTHVTTHATALTKCQKVLGPECTDNFQVVRFSFEGQEYWSAEQAFQGCKFQEGSKGRQRVLSVTPRVGESSSQHGMRCWSEGQTGKEDRTPLWDAVKVKVMLEVNRAKYRQHEDLRAQLLSTGSAELRGGPSTSWPYNGVDHNWSYWNGIIQMLIREEIREQLNEAGGTGERRDGEPSVMLHRLRSLVEEYAGAS